MICLAEKRIESILSGRRAASEQEMEHLIRCDRCRQIYLTLAELNLLLTHRLTVDMLQYVKNINDNILFPVMGADLPNDKKYRLAAKGGQVEEPYLLYSFSNEEGTLLGRVLQERDTGIVRFYLIGEDMEKVQGLKVELEDCKLDGITDLKGCIDFGRQGELQIRNVRVRTPVAVFNLSQVAEKCVDEEKHLFTIRNPEHDEVIIEIDRGQPRTRYHVRCSRRIAPGESATLQVVAITDQRTLTGFPEHGVTVLETENQEKVLKIHIY
ncbi:hypothetical protein JXO59_04075 [candidate division KSB1 bacterium]|nr:hypothetical protein [candidate division KSB1 bacterium]